MHNQAIQGDRNLREVRAKSLLLNWILFGVPAIR